MSGPPFPHAGEVYSLLAALVWSGAVICYKKSGETVHPVALNLFKNLASLVLFLPTAALFGGLGSVPVAPGDLLALVASGVLGIAVSDTYLFRCLQLLGAGLYSIVVCLYGGFVVGLSFLLLGERLSALQLSGVVAITVAIAVAVHQREHTKDRRRLLHGVAFGVVAMLTVAISIVLMKGALTRVGVLDAILIRVGAGVLGLLPWGLASGAGRRALATLTDSSAHWGTTVAGSVLGMYGATLLWVLGMKYTFATIASSLNQLSNVFVFVLGVLLLHERLTARKVLGLVVATAGSLLVILGG